MLPPVCDLPTPNTIRQAINKHLEANPVETLQNQFSGYGSTPTTVARTLDRLKLKEPLEAWSNETISTVVQTFTDEKFPTVFALNKIDHPDADKNISKIAKMQDPQSIVLCSAISEVFLRKLAKQGFVRYTEGSEFVDTREDLVEMGEVDGGGLKEMDEKLKARIENLKDMVLYRFGSTGVVQVLSRAAELLGLVPVFPVKNINGFGAGAGSNSVFRDCVLVKKGTTVKECGRKVMGDAPLAYVEEAGGIRVSEDEVVEVGKHDVGLSAVVRMTFGCSCSTDFIVQSGSIAMRVPPGQKGNIEHSMEAIGDVILSKALLPSSQLLLD